MSLVHVGAGSRVAQVFAAVSTTTSSASTADVSLVKAR